MPKKMKVEWPKSTQKLMRRNLKVTFREERASGKTDAEIVTDRANRVWLPLFSLKVAGEEGLLTDEKKAQVDAMIEMIKTFGF